LFFAAGLGSEKCVKMLLEEGADVHWQDKDGFTALHIAAGYVHNSVVKALLAFGADPEQEDNKGRSSLLLAQELLERTPRTNPMQFARRMALDQVRSNPCMIFCHLPLDFIIVSVSYTRWKQYHME